MMFKNIMYFVVTLAAAICLMIYVLKAFDGTTTIQLPGEIPQYWHRQDERTIIIIGHDPEMHNSLTGCIAPGRKHGHWRIYTFRDQEAYERVADHAKTAVHKAFPSE